MANEQKQKNYICHYLLWRPISKKIWTATVNQLSKNCKEFKIFLKFYK